MSKAQQISLRMPPALHAHLTALATRQGVSLNTLIITLLSSGSAFKF